MIDICRCWSRAWSAIGRRMASAEDSSVALFSENSSESGRVTVVVPDPCTLVTVGTATTGTPIVLCDRGSGQVRSSVTHEAAPLARQMAIQ